MELNQTQRGRVPADVLEGIADTVKPANFDIHFMPNPIAPVIKKW
jgi:hypothetical protein